MSTDDELRKIVNQEANALLGAQVSMASASDTRAAALLGVAVTLTGIAFGVLAAIYKDQKMIVLIGACWGTAVVACAAAGAALWAVWPTKLLLPGWGPRDFSDDTGRPLGDILDEMLSEGQMKIDSNKSIIEAGYRRSFFALGLLVASPVSGLAGAACGVGGFGILIAMLLWGGIAICSFLYFAPRSWLRFT